MNILSKPKSQVVEQSPPLPITSLSDGIFPEFSTETIDGLRHLITRMQQKDYFPRRLSIVSALRNEGVSYISQALAATIAYDLRRRICLVDLNYWWPNPSLQELKNNHTLADVIAGQATLRSALHRTSWSNIAILPAGDIPRYNRSMVAHSQTIRDVIDELQKHFDHLILDVPAILSTPDAVTLASLGEAACLVVRQGVTSKDEVERALDEIEHIRMVGVILNQYQLATPSWLTKLLTF